MFFSTDQSPPYRGLKICPSYSLLFSFVIATLFQSKYQSCWFHTFYCSGPKAWRGPPSMMILFAFEYAILVVTVIALMVKFTMHLVDIYSNGRSSILHNPFLRYFIVSYSCIFYVLMSTVLFILLSSMLELSYILFHWCFCFVDGRASR